MAVRKIKGPEKPLYQLAKEQLMELLETREVGDRLPSEEVLSRELGISRNTLREAIKVMAQKGWVQQRQGAGTFVVRKPRMIHSGLEKLESLDGTAKRNGWSCATEGVTIRSIAADRELSKKLKVDFGTRVTEVSRVKVINGHKVAFMTDLVPFGVLSEEDIHRQFEGSVLELLLANGAFTVDYAYTELKPARANPHLAGMLDVPEDSSLMLTMETVYGTDGTPLEHALNYMVPDLFNFHIIRRINHDGDDGSK